MNLKIKARVQRCVALMVLSPVVFAGGVLMTIPFAAASDTDNKTVEVNATIISPACKIDFTPKIFTPLEVNSARLETGKVSVTQKVNLKLSSCGLGYAAKRPVVLLSGTHPDTPEVPPGTDIAMIFKDPADVTNTALGYWVVVGKTDTPEVVDLYRDGDEVLSDAADTTGNGKESDIYIGVSCMSSSPCGKQAGSLKANLTFTFKYQ